MKKAFLILVALAISAACFSADKDTTKNNVSASNFGFHIGINYSNLRLQSSGFFVNDNAFLGSVSVINKFGVSGGCFINVKNTHLRIAAELTLMPSQIQYDNGKLNKEEHWIFPMTVELPLSYRWTFKNRKLPQINTGIRAVFPLSSLEDPVPVLKTFSFNADLGWAFPVRLKNTTMSAELIYSMGLVNLMDKSVNDYRNSSVQSLRRDFIGLRFYFN